MHLSLVGHRSRNGFTLIELLIVMAILSVLIGIVMIKLKPFQRAEQAYDIRRSSDVRQLEKALIQAMIDGHVPPSNIQSRPENAKWICQYSRRGLDCIDPPIDGVDLSYLVPTYLPAIPSDPVHGTGGITGYRMYKDGAFFLIEARYAEDEQ